MSQTLRQFSPRLRLYRLCMRHAARCYSRGAHSPSLGYLPMPSRAYFSGYVNFFVTLPPKNRTLGHAFHEFVVHTNCPLLPMYAYCSIYGMRFASSQIFLISSGGIEVKGRRCLSGISFAPMGARMDLYQRARGTHGIIWSVTNISRYTVDFIGE